MKHIPDFKILVQEKKNVKYLNSLKLVMQENRTN